MQQTLVAAASTAQIIVEWLTHKQKMQWISFLEPFTGTVTPMLTHTLAVDGN